MEREFKKTWTADEFREWMGRVEAKGATNGVLLFLWLRQGEPIIIKVRVDLLGKGELFACKYFLLITVGIA